MIEKIEFILNCLGKGEGKVTLSSGIDIIYEQFKKNKDIVNVNVLEEKRKALNDRLQEGSNNIRESAMPEER